MPVSIIQTYYIFLSTINQLVNLNNIGESNQQTSIIGESKQPKQHRSILNNIGLLHRSLNFCVHCTTIVRFHFVTRLVGSTLSKQCAWSTTECTRMDLTHSTTMTNSAK